MKYVKLSMNGPWKEQDSAFVDSFFLPGGILDPEDEEDIGILSTLPSVQPIPKNPWGHEKCRSASSSPVVSYLHAAKHNEIDAASPNIFGEQTMGEPEPMINSSPLCNIVRPPPGYDGYMNGLAPSSQLPNSASPIGPTHSNFLPPSQMNQASPVHCNGLPHQQNGFMSNMNQIHSPNQSNMGYQLSHQCAVSGQHFYPTDAYSARGPSLSVPSLANEVNPRHRNIQSTNFHNAVKQSVQPDQSTSAELKSQGVSTSKQIVQNPMENPVQEIKLKQENEESKESVLERNSITSTTVGTGESLDASFHMTPSCDSKDEVSVHASQHTGSALLSNDGNSVYEYSESQDVDDDLSPQDTAAPSLPEKDMSCLESKTGDRRGSATLEQHLSEAAQEFATSSNSKVTHAPPIQNSMSLLLQGILRPFSLVFQMVALLLLDLPRKGANAISLFLAAVYGWILSTAGRARTGVISVTKTSTHSISAGAKQSGETVKAAGLLLVQNISMVPAFVKMMSKASLIQALEEPSSGFCYLVLYFLPSWCNSLSENFDVPHWSAHFIITIAVYLVSHPVQPGILHRGEFPIVDVIDALFRNGNHCDHGFVDKDERQAAARKRNERICSKCLRVLRYCLPVFCLIDGFSFDGATMIGDSGASRLTTAFMMALVRRNLAFSPIGWVSWAVQVLVATYLDVWILRDTIVLLLGLSSFRLIRYLDQKRLKKKRKRR